jgi:cytochrome bd-type quinol oxidase subunit 2
MKQNVGSTDKTIRFVLAAVLFSILFIVQGNLRWIGLIGIVPLVTGLIGSCPLYMVLGISTRTTIVLFLLPLANLLLIANIPREISRGKEMNAFISSSLSIACLLALFGLGLFPNLVLSLPNPQNSLTIYNSSATPLALTNMLTITLIGLPFVLAYTVSIYWVFRGKVNPDHLHY